MRNLIFLATVFIAFGLSFRAAAQPADLGQIMRELDAEVKIISSQLENRESNKDSEARSLTVRKLFISMYAFLPEKIVKAKDEEKPKLVRAYDKFVAQEIALSSDLEGNFALDDNSAAKKNLDEMLKIRREAHRLFK